MRGSIWKKLAVVGGFALGVTMMSGQQVEAATTTGDINVTANVIATCAMTVPAFGFGTYDITAPGDMTLSAAVNVNCSVGAPYRIEMDGGDYQSGGTVDAPVRNMLNQDNGVDLLNYELTDQATGNPIGGSAASDVTGTGTGVGVDHFVDARIPALQVVASGNYSDIVTTTLNY